MEHLYIQLKSGVSWKIDMEGSTEIWTRIARFRVLSANHYTMEPQLVKDSRLGFLAFLMLKFWKINFWQGEGAGSQKNDEDGIRTHAGRAHWISSPTP